MKGSISLAALVLLILLLFPSAIFARPHSHHRRHLKSSEVIPKTGTSKREMNYKIIRAPDTLQVAGSRLPDCSHACGSCTPCRLVMVSFVCASIAESETCPMAYKCMCHNKSYPVP